MPAVYLDPSTDKNNEFVGGGTEEEYINLVPVITICICHSELFRDRRNSGMRIFTILHSEK